MAPHSSSAGHDHSDVVNLDSRDLGTTYVQRRINIGIQRFPTYNHFLTMDLTPLSTEALEDFQCTQPLDEDEDARVGVQTDVWYGRSVDGMRVCPVVRF